MIIGVGVDLADLARFKEQLAKTPALKNRLFTANERELPTRSLAARFAAKEALIKALGGSDGISWQDMEVLPSKGAKPVFTESLGLQKVLTELGAAHPQLSISHDGNMVCAFVVIETKEQEL